MLQTRQILANSGFIQPSGSTLFISGVTYFNNLNGKPNIKLSATNITLHTLNSGSTNNFILDSSIVCGGGFNGTIFSSLTQSDGKILLGGNFTHSSNTYTPGIARLNADGTPDTSFLPYITSTGFAGGVQAMALQPDGKIVAGGSFASYSGVTANGIIRLHPNGKVDATFVSGTGFDINSGTVNSITVQPDGKIVAIGTFASYSGVTANGIVRLHPNGKVDATFVSGAGFNTGAYPRKVIVQSDGKLVLGGFFNSYSGVTKNGIVRLNSNGSIDNTFFNGIGFSGETGFGDVNDIAIQSIDNKIIVVGDFNLYSGVTIGNGIIRLNTNGSVDNTFSSGVGFDVGNFSFVFPSTVKIQSDNKILVGGDFGIYNNIQKYAIVRLNTDGSNDNSFVGQLDQSSNILAIEPQSNGDIFLCGIIYSYAGIAQSNVVKIKSDGTLIDVFPRFNLGIVGSVLSTIITPDGKYLLLGSMNSFTGSTRGGIIKLNTDGTTDNTFLVGNFASSAIANSGVIQSDGKIIAGGSFTSYSGVTSNRIIRLHPNGKVDATFVIGTGFNTGTVNSITVEPTTNIIVSGSFNSYSGVTSQKLIRLNSNGSINTSLGTRFTSTVVSTLLQLDGKILCTGTFLTYSGITANRIVRLNNNGTLDNTFIYGTGLDATTNPSKLLLDGSYLIGGSFTTYNGTPVGKIIKLSSSGILDTTFNILNTDGAVNTIGVQSDGLRIIIGGTFSKVDNNSRTGFARLANTPVHLYVSSIAGIEYLGDYSAGYTSRSLTDKSYTDTKANSIIPTAVNGLTKSGNNIRLGGTLTGNTRIALGSNTLSFSGSSASIGFSATGNSSISIASSANLDMGGSTGSLLKFSQNFGNINNNFNGGAMFSDPVLKSVVQSDGKFIVNGSILSYSGSTVKKYFIRFNVDGTVDSTYTNAFSFISSNDMILQSDGKLIVAANANFSYGQRIARFNTDGSYDTSFIINGTSFTGFDLTANALGLQSDGKIIVGGSFNSYSGVTANHIIRLHPNGRADATFISGTGFGTGFTKTVNSIAVQPSDGKIIIVGNFTTYSGVSKNGIVRLHPNGKLDATFLTGSGISNANKIVIQPDNKILIAGSFTSYSGISVSKLIRLNTNGTLDNSFKTNSGFTGGNNTIYNIKLQSNGRILVGGEFTKYSGVTRNGFVCLNSNGSIDNTFFYGGDLNNLTLSQPVSIQTISILTGNTIFLGGTFSGVNGVNKLYGAVLNSGGTSTDFFKIKNVGFNSLVYCSEKYSNDRVLVGGLFSSYSGVTYNGLVRLYFNGTIDKTFVIGNGISGGGASVAVIRVQSDGKILVGGSFSTYGVTARNNIVRLNADGTIDNTFVIGSGFSNSILDIRILTNNKILVSGNFSAYSGVTKYSIVRLNSNGSLDNTFKSADASTAVIYEMGIQSTDKIIIVGDIQANAYTGNTRNSILRLNSNGSLDNTFNNGGSGFTPTFSASLRGVTIYNDKIFVVGYFSNTYYNTVQTGSDIIKLNSDGTVDNSLNVNGNSFSGFDSAPLIVVPLSDGKILVGGYFRTYRNIASVGFAKLNSDGTLDVSSNIDTGCIQNIGFNAGMETITLLDNNNVFVGGNFTGFNKKPVRYGGIIDFSYKSSFENIVGVEYGSDYSNSFTNLSLVHKGYVKNKIQTDKNIVVLSIITTTPFTATTTSHYLHVSGTTAMVVYLPAIPKLSQVIIVADAKGNALSNNITINGNSKKINGSTTGIINANYGVMTLVYNGINWYGK